MAEHILYVEDDQNIAKLTQATLEKAGYRCSWYGNGADALDAMQKEPVDLVLLDVMLPGMSGFDICRTIKQAEKLKNIPVIILSSKVEEVDKVVGLELGADDYVPKPFSPRELILRIKAVLRRYSLPPVASDTLSSGPVVVDIPRHSIFVGGQEVPCTRMEFKLLVVLMERAGRVQSRERLLADVWDIHGDVDTRTVDTHIKRLREKLGAAGAMIDTVVGVGYRFNPQQ